MYVVCCMVSTFAPENLVSRKTGSAVPSLVSPRSFSTLWLNLVLTHGLLSSFLRLSLKASFYYHYYTVKRHRVSPASYRVTQLRTDRWRSPPRVQRNRASRLE